MPIVGAERRHFDAAMSNPTSPMLLLDRLFTHQRCMYVSSWNDKGHTSLNKLSIADMYLYFMLVPWMDYYKSFADELATTIPAVLVYVQRIRKELMELVENSCGSGSFFSASQMDEYFNINMASYIEDMQVGVDWSN